jgi:hypothetical protein
MKEEHLPLEAVTKQRFVKTGKAMCPVVTAIFGTCNINPISNPNPGSSHLTRDNTYVLEAWDSAGYRCDEVLTGHEKRAIFCFIVSCLLCGYRQ